ncbi:hypothetical protein ACFW9F_22650 [Streptomyces sp. NPDC059506]|uniref:hypothetical protein n=1 Tax=Streptomyces TaxID=1883 RepID=UPI0015FBAD85|nr:MULTISPECIES: hypothetical protein [unclassified Streptomyces]MCZ2525235.1 hypothetical protein [Streptomyces sp. HB2AG]QMV24439.1 hypothetical protein GQS52_24645 [Streptomyces sp. SCUT-3]
MPALKRSTRAQRTSPAFDAEPDPEPDELPDIDEELALDEESWDIVRLRCPDCERPIAVFTDEDVLPRHALCPTAWNPFGLTVCKGSGRSVDEAAVELPARDDDAGVAALLTLPEGLDWRTQPFSHAGGPGSRPLKAQPAPTAMAPRRSARAA